MKKPSDEMDDELRPEYDFSQLKVIARGRGREKTHEPRPIILAPDVQAYFPDAEAVNQALRGLIALVPEKRD